MRHFILIPHLKLHNANALSSPYTIGFPAMTAWLGAVHALQRKLQQKKVYVDISLKRVGISCHQFDLQTYNDSIVMTRNPLNEDGKPASFIADARCHLEVSLLVEILNYRLDIIDSLKKHINELIFIMKFASGDVLSVNECEIVTFNDRKDKDEQLKPILNKLMPGYILIGRRDLVVKAMEEEQKDALEVILDYLKVTHSAQEADDGKAKWSSNRKTLGWIIPIAVGFQGISELGSAIDQRDNSTPHRFAESVITLGEFIMPYRIKQIDDMLWEYHVELENNLYLCQNLTK